MTYADAVMTSYDGLAEESQELLFILHGPIAVRAGKTD